MAADRVRFDILIRGIFVMSKGDFRNDSLRDEQPEYSTGRVLGTTCTTVTRLWQFTFFTFPSDNITYYLYQYLGNLIRDVLSFKLCFYSYSFFLFITIFW